MKLSKAQRKILEHMARGGIYCRMWFGIDEWGSWSGTFSRGPRSNIRSIYKLQELGLIECYDEAWQCKYYRITDAGREQSESSPAGGR